MMDHPMFHFIVVTNEPNPIHHEDLHGDEVSYLGTVSIVNTKSEDLNLSKWWNLGAATARRWGNKEFMVTETDCRLTPESVFRLWATMKEHDLSMVGPNLYGVLEDDEVSIERSQDGWASRSVYTRICQTWMVDLRNTHPADERFPWWHADEQHEMRHRSLLGGTGIVGSVRYERPLFQTTNPDDIPELQQGNARARQIFEEEWGFPTMT